MVGFLKSWILVSSMLALGACSTASLTAGTNLATVGQKASAQMETNVTLSGDTMTALRTAVAFSDGFNNQIGNPDSAKFIANEVAIQDKLSKYGKMLDSLTEAYAALGDLSQYDASGTFNASVTTLANDASTFGKSIDPNFAIPAEATTAVATAGSLIIGAWQERQVKDASRKIELILNTVIDVLKQPDTRALLVMNSQEDAGMISQAGIEVLSTNIYSYGPMLDSIAAPLKLKAVPDADAVIAKDPRLKRGLQNSVLALTEAQLGAMGASYDKSLSALKALVPLHEALQNGAPLDLDRVIAITTQLQTIATALKPTKGK